MIVEIIGWAGSLFIILAYAMIFLKKCLLTCLLLFAEYRSSACMIVNTIYHQAIPSAVVNMFG